MIRWFDSTTRDQLIAETIETRTYDVLSKVSELATERIRLDDVSAALLLLTRLTVGHLTLTQGIVVRIHGEQPILLTLINTFSILAILRRVEGVTTIRNRIEFYSSQAN